MTGELPVCICGEEVACAHVECMALLAPEDRKTWPRLRTEYARWTTSLR